MSRHRTVLQRLLLVAAGTAGIWLSTAESVWAVRIANHTHPLS
jgi:hypothetical protein